MTQHDGRIAVVTGAAAGIGRDYAVALAEQGATVLVADIDEAGARATVEAIEAQGGKGQAAHVDVSDRDSTLALAETARSMGGAHILVNNAAMYAGVRFDPQLEVDIDYWRRVFSVNLDGALLVTQAVAPLLVEAGWGRIVMQTSTAAYSASGAYGVSKLALLGLMRGFAQELGPRCITVNALAPGAIMTEATLSTLTQERIDRQVAKQLIRRPGATHDVVAMLLFLCSDAASWVTGQTMVVDGGMTPRL